MIESVLAAATEVASKGVPIWSIPAAIGGGGGLVWLIKSGLFSGDFHIGKRNGKGKENGNGESNGAALYMTKEECGKLHAILADADNRIQLEREKRADERHADTIQVLNSLKTDLKADITGVHRRIDNMLQKNPPIQT